MTNSCILLLWAEILKCIRAKRRKEKNKMNEMNEMIQQVNLEINKLEKMMRKIDDYLKEAPVGCLKWQKKGERTYYYQQYNDNKSQTEVNELEDIKREKNKSKWKRKYITKENITLAKSLAKKHYYITLKGVIEKRIKALKAFVKYYPNREIDTIYEELSEERKKLINPIVPTLKDKVKQWDEEFYEINTSFPENLRYETEQGEKVRSKSEVIIANLLYQNRNDILYKYEKLLEVIDHGRKKTIYPDFTIMNVHTGKVVYWEHAGRMDDPLYANDFVKKMNLYSSNGFMIGRDVVVTYETSATPLDINVVKKLIKELR